MTARRRLNIQRERESHMKVVITARNFTAPDESAVALLKAHGFEVINRSGTGLSTGAGEDAVAALFGDADIAISALEPVGETVLQRCPNLKLVSRRGIGYDSVDLDACRRHGVAVVRATGAVEAAVAEQVMAYILYFARRIDAQNARMHAGQWSRVMSYGAKNRTLGLVGFGGIGKEVARRAVPFGMQVLYYCRHPRPEWENEYHVQYAPLDELLRASDYLSVNVPLTPATQNMFGEAQFAQMKPECVFINIARSGVVDTLALKRALDSGAIRGAGVDVYDHEPCTDSPLITCQNAVLTPHTAPFTSENFREMNLCAARNVINFVAGTLEEKYRLV